MTRKMFSFCSVENEMLGIRDDCTLLSFDAGIVVIYWQSLIDWLIDSNKRTWKHGNIGEFLNRKENRSAIEWSAFQNVVRFVRVYNTESDKAYLFTMNLKLLTSSELHKSVKLIRAYLFYCKSREIGENNTVQQHKKIDERHMPVIETHDQCKTTLCQIDVEFEDAYASLSVFFLSKSWRLLHCVFALFRKQSFSQVDSYTASLKMDFLVCHRIAYLACIYPIQQSAFMNMDITSKRPYPRQININDITSLAFQIRLFVNDNTRALTTETSSAACM